jgi:hypothetical protein
MTGKPEGIFLKVGANGARAPHFCSNVERLNRLQKKSQRRKKLTAGAKARKHFRRLNGTTEVMPFPSAAKSEFFHKL